MKPVDVEAISPSSRAGEPFAVVLAPDKFKGSMTAGEVIDVMATVLAEFLPSAEIHAIPMADGGDGTLDAVLARGFARRTCAAVDGLGRPLTAPYGVRGDTAVLELAAICGLAVTGDRDVRRASSLGLGMVARHAVAEGARHLLIGLGGSASVDGGLGFVQGLGLRALDGAGVPVSSGLAELARVRRVDLTEIPADVRACTWQFLLDVENPLTGPTGAAAVFGPQKGLAPADIAWADDALSAWAGVLGAQAMSPDPGMGAAGGIALAGRAILGARAEPGAPWIASLVGLAESVASSSLVITGEGAFDEQSLSGKAPGEVIKVGRAHGVPVRVLAGSVGLSEPAWRAAGVDRVAALSDVAGSVSSALAEPRRWAAEAMRTLV